MAERLVKIAQLKTPEGLRARLAELGCDLPVDERILTAGEGSPLAASLVIGGFRIGNRWCIHPMEGWDANTDGSPSAHTLRRWRHFGESGAKLIWGGEAAAVRPDGRANPNQTVATPENRAGLAALLQELRAAHQARYANCDNLLVGLQLTHSGRFSKPTSAGPAPRIAYHHPILDGKFGIDPADDSVIWTDSELERLIESFVAAARLARDVGFQFVDVKACHGYLLHELLSAFIRPGPFGGDFAGRTRVLRTIIERVRDECPGLLVAVRLSVFDTVPYEHGPDAGRPVDHRHLLPYRFGFGLNADEPLQIDLHESIDLLHELKKLGVVAVNLSCGSPYYTPHVQRPAAFPPSDGYAPPEDPLVGVWRQIDAARRCKAAVPDLPMVGTGYSYLQDFLPHVAQAVLRQGWIDAVGIGRMVLAYPHLPDDVLRQGRLDRKRVCRTFSDCTTAPRNGLVSGCFPLDPYYKALPEARLLREFKS
ncbi:MAG: NADH:flavin oxidoreductase [Planctomycetia bacterium]|nr:NADH:flavin oxidoreductase [Planctomycetia bacterium]